MDADKKRDPRFRGGDGRVTLNENLLIGLVCLALVPLIGMRIVRGVRSGQMPVYRTYLDRDGNEGKFYALLALNGAALILVAVIAADLLLGLNLRNAS